MKKTLAQLAAAAGMVVVAATTGLAQNNLGSDCGCPQVSSRPTKNLSTYCDVNGNLNTSTYLFCDTTYIVDTKVWVGAGKTLTVAPGTVVKGALTAVNTPQNSIVVMIGGKLVAEGTTTCPIVFTSANDPVNGTYPVGTRGDWGGIQMLGKAQLNRIAGTYGSTVCTAGQWVMEGLNNDARSIFGGGLTPDNHDNSGVLRYVSIRHAGGAVAANVELNGLSLGAVGDGTILENLEIISNDDDAIEFWGGTVNVKYTAAMFVNDDNFDMDDDYDGKMQFLFALKAPYSVASGGEAGFEWDGDDAALSAYGMYPSAVSTARSHPVIYNATVIGNFTTTGATGTGTTTGNPFGVSAKSDAEGEIYNSIFAGFNSAFNLQNNGTSDSSKVFYDQGLFKIACNTYIPDAVGFGASAQNVVFSGADSTKFFTTDNNIKATTIPGFDATFAINGTTNAVSDNIDVTPSPALTTSCFPAADGFFTPVNYRGAFDATKKPWLNKWALTSVINIIPGLSPCPTDLNADGFTNTSDFLIFVAQFNLACN